MLQKICHHPERSQRTICFCACGECAEQTLRFLQQALWRKLPSGRHLQPLHLALAPLDLDLQAEKPLSVRPMHWTKGCMNISS